MIKKILIWILKKVDVSVTLEGDLLSIRLILGGTTLFEYKLDLVPNEEGPEATKYAYKRGLK